ncbi:MAG: ankyrin repeat domain-containing protein [Balneolaceae bacterium]|nr:ankyrin repeat domain-containing protein [Balneolaceae bacterium]
MCGPTALMFASYNGHLDVIRYLVDNGAQLDRKNKEGRTALMFAASGPFPDVVQYLLEQGADPNRTDMAEGWSPLMYAAAEGNTEVVKILLSHGADPELKDKDGDTAADFAQNNGHTEIAKLLKK